MNVSRHSRWWAFVVLAGAVAPLVWAEEADLTRQKEDQKRVQARVAEAARRAGSTIDAMVYQRLPASVERKMLEEVARGLRDLSQEQIEQVLQYLERAIAAQQARDLGAASEAQKQAYAKQREILSQLRSLLIKLDLIRNLDEAAARLDAAAEKQLSLNAETLSTARWPRRDILRRPIDDRQELANEQNDLRNEITALFKQIEQLLPHLNAEQKARVAQADYSARAQRLLQELQSTVALLREGQWELAADRQRRHAKELKDLAHALRTPPGDRVSALKNAQEKLQRAIDAQQKVREQTEQPPSPEMIDKARRNGQNPDQVRGHELAHQQAKAEFVARDARKAAEQADPQLADMLKPVENQQWKAEDALRQGQFDKARPPQEQALEKLRQAKEEIDRRLAETERAKADPRTAVQQAAERLDKLIEQQKEAQAKTERAEKNPERLPLAKQLQQEVLQGTQQLRDIPLPPNPDLHQALQKATQAMQKAQQNLEARQPQRARPDQQQALQALEQARQALEQQLKAIDQRREDIARLEELKNQLEELAKNERDLAQKAQQAAEKPADGPNPQELAQQQRQLQPPTDDAEKQLQQMAQQRQQADPQAAQQLQKAAEAVRQAQQNQQQAQENLQKQQPQQGAEQARQAADKLQQAARQLQEQLNQKRGEEANDQAALQPQRLDPNNAAQQLQQAIEQAQRAAEQAQKAQQAQQQANGNPQQASKPQQTNQQPQQGQPDLAQLQKQLAQDARQQELTEAAQAANQAAEALEKGDLRQAIENQQKALAELNKAAQQQPGQQGQQQNQQNGQQQPNQGQQGQQPGNQGQQGQQPGNQGQQGQQPGQAAGQLAQRQQQLLEAARALQQSQQATKAAQAALQQAQANTPMAVQDQLQQAAQQLQQAAQQLQQGQPGQAGNHQQQAAQQLQQALQALEAAQQQAQANNSQQPGMNQQASQQGQQPGQQPGQQGQQPGQQQANNSSAQQGQQPGQPGQQQANNNASSQQQGPGRTTNPTVSEGDQNGDEKLGNAASAGNPTTGDGTFIQLRNKERERVQQGADARLPAEFREWIKLFNMNIKNARPANPTGGK